MDIKREIADRRLERIKTEGYGLSVSIPEEREVPLNNFSEGPFVICEVKRGSPSKGGFAKGLDAVAQATHYRDSGVKHISVLTEEDRFLGSLNDLMEIKRACPEVAVLRKDFLLDLEDVKTSYLCGADAFLLIASLLDKESLVSMYNFGVELGMTPLVEIHDKEDADKVRELKPALTGINSRNLANFTIDPLLPLKIRSYIDWECDVVYESGITSKTDGEFARDCGFSGVLVGEWAVKKADLAKDLINLFQEERRFSPWERLYKRYNPTAPFIKICGLTNRDDLLKAKELGADMFGFILAESPRKVGVDFIKSVGDVDGLKVGVVVLKKDEQLSEEILKLITDGYLDFIQYHGEESDEQCIANGAPYFKALSIKDMEDLEKIDNYSKVTLIDAFSKEAHGGTGKRISDEITTVAAKEENLWLAGGLNPDNISEIIEKYSPDLVDVSSGVEQSPGKKDHNKLERYFSIIKEL